MQNSHSLKEIRSKNSNNEIFAFWKAVPPAWQNIIWLAENDRFNEAYDAVILLFPPTSN